MDVFWVFTNISHRQLWLTRVPRYLEVAGSDDPQFICWSVLGQSTEPQVAPGVKLAPCMAVCQREAPVKRFWVKVIYRLNI